MKVISKRIPSEINFQEVKEGAVFVYDEGAYMKLDGEYDSADEQGCNAVYLETGELCRFGDWDVVSIPTKVVPIEIHW